MLNLKNKYAPDVLDCIANLSNDEVFTSPKLANQMLDMVPQELFTNPRAKFLDPCCKSGVFLREIVKRLDKGLEDIIPDRQKRIDHILHNQVFGIAITELTAQLSRRTVYCSKYACAIQSGDVWISDENDDEHGIHETHSYSISEFTADDVNDFCINPIQGNVRFDKTIKHTFDSNGVCQCGATTKHFTEYAHAYELIHIDNTRLEELKNMQWDLIISNPPYQLKTTEIEGKSNATPIYNKFIEQAKKLCPRYLAMIIPARWYAGGTGLDSFREAMLNDDSIREIHDFVNEKDCFSGVKISGGVCYFLRDASYHGECKVSQHVGNDIISETKRPLLEKGLTTFIRHNDAISILNKVRAVDDLSTSFSSLVSPQTPFGIISSFKDFHDKKADGDVKFYTNKNVGYIDPKHIKARKEFVGKYKVYISAAYGAGEGYPHQIINKPFLGEENSCCSQTYLVVGPFDTVDECNNVCSYMRTKFFRFMVMLKKNAQHAMRGVYELVPLQDFSKQWTDEELYKKYNLTQDEIDFIESMIKPMNDDGKNDETEE